GLHGVAVEGVGEDVGGARDFERAEGVGDRGVFGSAAAADGGGVVRAIGPDALAQPGEEGERALEALRVAEGAVRFETEAARAVEIRLVALLVPWIVRVEDEVEPVAIAEGLLAAIVRDHQAAAVGSDEIEQAVRDDRAGVL